MSTRPIGKARSRSPHFIGLNAASTAPVSATGTKSTSARPPGDVILVHAGLYKGNRLNYVDPLGIPFDGAYVFTLKGTPEKPIVIRGAGDGEAIFDGAGSFRLFDVMAADYHIFEGLTIRNTDVAFGRVSRMCWVPRGSPFATAASRTWESGSTHSTQARQTSTSRITFFLGATTRTACWAGRVPISTAPTTAELLCGQGLRLGPRDLSQRGGVFSRWDRRQHARNTGEGAGTEGGRDRHLQQRHSCDRGRFHRVRRRRTQYPCDAQPGHKCRAHRAERAAGLWRPRLFHSQRRSTMLRPR